MLSKLSSLVLGIISENERSPYEITKLVKEMEIDKWFPIGDSTVYATINKLSKEKLIVGEKFKTGNLPEKTVYKITEKGSEEMQESILAFLEDVDTDAGKFDFGIILMNQIRGKQILPRLKTKLQVLESKSHDIKKQIIGFELSGKKVAFGSLALVKHRRHLIEAEIKTIKEMIRELNISGMRKDLTAFDFRLN
ncbi:MAG: PadR family transcriptional regulator [Melioribacteraceae bacterium]|nr:PadR family transcriptional regulator [Melioribacteraceae bacterium]MCF8263176.1 PadR family transcriptional regulator [Melioribacteraceae bacterium]MCF8414046.1 PadR family transcriptional regulator [Melioribacteraceae bacterium]MCF8430336.1 PadR family transcriptional regulator [Melioribacteraceae bacterium]